MSAQLYTLKNDDLEISVLDVGATLHTFKSLKDNINIVSAYEDIDLYLGENGPYLGSSVGPVCGRLAHSKFGDVQLVSNEANQSHLHGGSLGISKTPFQCEVLEERIVCTLRQDHSVDGYPGVCDYTITYQLKGNQLILSHTVTPTTPQFINTTNHSYFNLEGSDSIKDHQFQINADKICLVNEFGWHLGESLNVEGTIFDYRSLKPLSEVIDGTHDQYQFTRNLDHFFYGNKIQLRKGNKVLDVETDRTGFQIYASNYFDEAFTLEGGTLAKNHTSLAIEPQHFNNAPNLGPVEIYDKDHPYTSKTVYTLRFE